MKHLYIFLLCFFSSLIALSKPASIDTLKQRVKNIELKTKSHDSLLIINNHLILEKSKLISQNNDLKEKVDYNEKLLEKYDKLNNTIFTTIAILLAVFGLAIPLLGYFFVYKPSKDELKEAKKLLNDIENDMDKLFSNFLIKNRDKFIDNVLTGLENNHEKIRVVEEINRLESYSVEGFNDKQILRIIKLFRNDEKHRKKLFCLIQQEENIFTTEFFRNELIKKSNVSIWALKYAAQFDKEEFLDDIVDYILKSTDKFAFYISYTHMSNHNAAFVAKLFDNDILVNEIPDAMLKVFIHRKAFKIPSMYKNTKLYPKYASIIGILNPVT